jgi:hypothetical protein
LNRYTKSQVHPEGSMVQGYSAEEVVDWCLGVFQGIFIKW